MYCILTKYTVDDPMLKVGGGHILFCRRIYGGDKKIRQIKTFGGG